MQFGIENSFGFRNSEVPVFWNFKAKKKKKKNWMFGFPEIPVFWVFGILKSCINLYTVLYNYFTLIPHKFIYSWNSDLIGRTRKFVFANSKMFTVYMYYCMHCMSFRNMRDLVKLINEYKNVILIWNKFAWLSLTRVGAGWKNCNVTINHLDVNK